MSMGECIAIHVGQAGIEMGTAVWELLCLEHGVRQDGCLLSRNPTPTPTLGSNHSMFSSRSTGLKNIKRMPSRLSTKSLTASSSTFSDLSLSSRFTPSCRGSTTNFADTKLDAFFETLEKGKVAPRALFVDTDCTAINKIRNGRSRRLHRSSHLLCTREDTRGVFSTGYFTNQELTEKACDRITNMAAKCDNLQAILVFRSLGGGTGSGLGSALLLRLADEYGCAKKSIIEIDIGPTLKDNTLSSAAALESYNSVISTHKSMYSSESAIIFDNLAMFKICRTLLDVDYPQYDNLNRLVGQVMSSLTASLRYSDTFSVQLKEFQTNIIPFPRLKFPIVSFAPLGKKTDVETQCGQIDVTMLTKDCFKAANHFMEFDPRVGNYLGCTMLYRGDVGVDDVNKAIQKVKRLERFRHKCEPDILVGITKRPAPSVPFGNIGRCSRSGVLFSNTTAVKDSWRRVLKMFNMMLDHRAYVHWYLQDGMELDDIRFAGEDIATLVQEYDDVDDTVSKRIEAVDNEDISDLFVTNSLSDQSNQS